MIWLKIVLVVCIILCGAIGLITLLCLDKSLDKRHSLRKYLSKALVLFILLLGSCFIINYYLYEITHSEFEKELNKVCIDSNFTRLINYIEEDPNQIFILKAKFNIKIECDGEHYLKNVKIIFKNVCIKHDPWGDCIETKQTYQYVKGSGVLIK